MCESFPYRLRPAVPVVSPPGAAVNAAGICAKVGGACAGPRTVVIVECYPGVDPAAVLSLFSPLRPVLALLSDDLALPESVIDDLIRDDLTDDPVFGHITRRAIGDFFDPRALQAARDRVDRVSEGIVLLYGTGASLIHPGDVLV